jgi:hypothetical protein
MADTADIHNNNFFGFVLWLLWVAIATLVLGGMAYLFVGGSSFFSEYNSVPVVLYRQINNDIGTVAVNGSIVIPSKCHRLGVESYGDALRQVLDFSIYKESGCIDDIESSDPVPETFFVEFAGGIDTEIQVLLDSIEQQVIIK